MAISIVIEARSESQMFETAVQEKRTGMLWGVIVAFAALAALLGAGYMLIN
jgi:hypothetical protein